jgi:hypothetical protein
MQKAAGLPIPVNKSAPKQPNADRVLRFLDCAVIKHLHSIIASQPPGPGALEPFDSVRGMFVEGGRLYDGSGFHKKSHVQLAVINPECIIGVFKPRALP